MKKIVFLFTFNLLFISCINAQSVGINNSSPDASSIFDIKSINKGLLIPRMTTVQRTAIAAPAKGLIVFDITTNGLWFHNGIVWNVLSSGSTTNFWTAKGSDIYNNNAGNVGIGTTAPANKLQIGSFASSSINGNDIAIGNGTQAMSFYQSATNSGWYTTNNFALLPGVNGTGNVGIGIAAPLAKLHIAGNVKIDGSNTLEFGAGIAGKEVSAGKIGYQSFGLFDALDIVGAGTGANRKIKFWNEGGAEFSGNIGVGNTATAYKMDIADRIRIRSSSVSSTAGVALNNSNNSAVSAFIGTKDLDLVGMYGSNSGWGLLMNTNTGALAVGYQNPVAGYRLSVLGNQYINGLIASTGDAEIGGSADVTGNLYVGGRIVIGENDQNGQFDLPSLEVRSSVDYTVNVGWSYYDNCTTGTSCIYTRGLSIRAYGHVMSDNFICISDARIKNIAGASNSAKDLETINALQITDYTMKDKIMFGNKSFKKVIAQQVEKVYPQVIATNTGYIPNVYAVPSKIEKTANGYLLSFIDKHNLTKTAKKIQVMTGRVTNQYNIVSIPSDTQVEIRADNLATDKVFVYGEEVDDFKAVDYEGLTTLNISATQELSKLIKKQQVVIETQEQQIEQLLKRMAAFEKK
ncbi:MAG: tail fiber domain-containing protein [Ferruginibacter sp.]|nr:tail fiber domain-containing protein [Ferruginibacter sp.]